MDLFELAGIALDEAGYAMDAEIPTVSQHTAMPQDLVLHDNKYHHGHWNGKSKCKYREDRAKALEGKQESEWQDIIDKLTPEDVDGEEIDKADILDPEAHPNESSSTSPKEEVSSESLKTILGKMKGSFGKAILGRAIQKHEAESLEPKLAKLREFAKSLGLDPDKISYESVMSGHSNTGAAGNTQASVSELKAQREKFQNQMDRVMATMKLVTPDIAAGLQAEVDEFAKKINAIDKQLSGGESSKHDDEKARKAKKKALQEQQKKDIKKFNETMAKGQTMPFAQSPEQGKSVALDSATFKKEFEALPINQKIFALSDFHETDWKKLGTSGSGVVMIAGDMNDALYSSPKFNEPVDTQIKRAQQWIDGEFSKYCNKHPNQQFVIIPGNHDNVLGLPESKDLKWPSNVTLLNDSETTVNGMRIYGTGICGRREGMDESYFKGRPFELTPEEYKKRADAIPEGLDVLMIHHPPKDKDYNGDVTSGKDHSGVEYLAEIIKQKKPKLVICGHLHDADHRPYRIGDSVVINTSRVGTSRRQADHTPHHIGMTGNSGDIGFFVDGEDQHLSK